MSKFRVTKQCIMGIRGYLHQIGAEVLQLNAPQDATDKVLRLLAKASSNTTIALGELSAAEIFESRTLNFSKSPQPISALFRLPENEDKQFEELDEKPGKTVKMSGAQQQGKYPQENFGSGQESEKQKGDVEHKNNDEKIQDVGPQHKDGDKKQDKVVCGQTGNWVPAGPKGPVLAFLLQIKTKRRQRTAIAKPGEEAENAEPTKPAVPAKDKEEHWACHECKKQIGYEKEYLECDMCKVDPVRFHPACLRSDSFVIGGNRLNLPCCCKNPPNQ